MTSAQSRPAAPLLHRFVSMHAAARPDARAVGDVDGMMTFAALHRRSAAIAAALTRDGVGAGDRVVFAGENSVAVPLLLAAASMLGAIVAPLNWRLSEAEMAAIIADIAPAVVVHSPRHAELAKHTAGEDISWLPTEALGATSSWLAGALAAPVSAEDPEAPLVIIYTSGSSGRAKGVVLSQRNLIALNLDRNDTLPWDRWTPTDATLIAAPLGHIGSLGMLIRAMIFGAFAQIDRAFTAERTLAAIAEHRLTKLALVPTALKALLDHPDVTGADLSSVDTVTYGAAPITPALLDEALARMNARFTQSYGLSESGGSAICLEPVDHDRGRPHLLAAAGRPLPGCAVRIMRDDREARPGDPGEIWLSSPATMRGYWRRPEDTARVLPGDGWLRTGDVGFVDDEGYLFISGRLSEMIISGGENIYPAEVEAALCAHAVVHSAAVFGLPDPHWGEIVAAAVVFEPGVEADEGVLGDWVRTRIAGYKAPRKIFMRAALPLNSTGKIDKLTLRDECAARRASSCDSEIPDRMGRP